MQYSKSLAILATVGAALAQRPSSTPICDYYTTALLKDNTAKNQYTLLTLLVNTAVIGNYTQPNVGVMVPGILAPGQYNGTDVNLLPYFDGGLKSTNVNQKAGVSNFLDGGGAAPLLKNMPADDTTSNQYTLLTHLYEYFGVLLGCSMIGNPGYPAYDGDASMYETHRFMALSSAQIGYFVTQVGLSAASFGVAQSDIAIVGTALEKLFGYRCSPPTTVVAAQGAQLQSICTDTTCPRDPKPMCSAYPDKSGASRQPYVANATLAMGEGRNQTINHNSTSSSTGVSSAGAYATMGSSTSSDSASASPTASPSTTPMQYTPGSGAGAVGMSLAMLLGAAVFALAL